MRLVIQAVALMLLWPLWGILFVILLIYKDLVFSLKMENVGYEKLVATRKEIR